MGHSEILLGQAFRQGRDRVVIATKGGMSNAAGEQDFSAEYLRKALEQSLRRLNTDYVDLYQLHSPPVELLEDEEIRSFLDGIVRTGKVRSVGFSARSPLDALATVKRHDMTVVQANLNLLDWRAVDCGLLEHCRETGTSVIARTPLCFGFLTGRYTADDVTDPDDHRSRWPREKIEQWITAAPLFAGAITSGGTQTAGQRALRFCLSFAGVATVIPGMLTPAHVAENCAAADLGPLTPAELAAAEKIYRELTHE